eukprot:XP_001693835.1 predicted protein [Chlamydomonas reinhardtii]
MTISRLREKWRRAARGMEIAARRSLQRRCHFAREEFDVSFALTPTACVMVQRRTLAFV